MTLRSTIQRFVLSISAIGSMLLLWEFLSGTGVIDPVLFPKPSSVASALWKDITQGTVLKHAAPSISRTLVGSVVGAVIGIPLGITIGESPTIRAIAEPVIDTTYPLPKIALLPLLLVVLGLGEEPLVALAAIGMVYPVTISTAYGARSTNQNIVLMARNLGATRFQVMAKILLPSSGPYIAAGMRLGLGLALALVLAGEMVGAGTTSGLGFYLWFTWQTLFIAQMYGTLFLTAGLGLLISHTPHLLARLLFPWMRVGRGDIYLYGSGG